MKTTFLAIAAFGVSLSSFAAVTHRYTVSTVGRPSSAALRVASNAHDSSVRTFVNLHGFAADLTDAEVEALRKTEGVQAVEPVVERWISSVDDDETTPSEVDNYDTQITPWGIAAVHAAAVWPYTRGRNVNVVVLDTGIDATHPDLQGVYAGGYNVFDPTQPPADNHFHGTHVAGIIAAANNDFGVVGVAPEVRLWGVKVLDQSGKGFDEGIAAGLDWVMSKQRELGGRWVVNMSFSAGQEGGGLEREAVRKAVEQGIILVAATGNNGTSNIEYPAIYNGVIAVGAVGEDGLRAEFSAYGTHMGVVAPGVNVPSTYVAGYLEKADVVVGDETFTALGLIGSPKTQMSGRIVNSGLGRPEEFLFTVKGNIALIGRGDLAFREKSRNAKEAGATSVIIYDSEPNIGLKPFTLLPRGCPGPECGEGWNDYVFPLTVNVTYEDGQKLLALANRPAKVTYEFVRYGKASGTSMAAPHVTGVVALMLALAPELNSSEIARVLRSTARDTATPGWDYETAYGIVDAFAAGKWVAPATFGVPPPNPAPQRRRSVHP